MFEEILKNQGNSKFISAIWTECELWRNQNIIVQCNAGEKHLIDYVLKSNDDGNFFAFLVFDFEQESDAVTKNSKNCFLKLKNSQFIEKVGKSIFQKIYSIIDSECEEICYDILKKLLKEREFIEDIQGEVAIDNVLKMTNEVYKHKILTILLTYWKIFSKEYENFKVILSNTSPFYGLFFTLKEENELEFEVAFPQYLESMQEKYGEVKTLTRF